MSWNLPDGVTGNEDYTAKIEIYVTENARDETEALEKIEDLLDRAQFIWDHDILDIKKDF